MLRGYSYRDRAFVDIDSVYYFRLMSADSLTDLVGKKRVEKCNSIFKIYNRKIVFNIYLYQKMHIYYNIELCYKRSYLFR